MPDPKTRRKVGTRSSNDQVNHPPHYTQSSIECIDAIDAAITDKPGHEAYYVGTIIKYLWRYNSKGGVESLEKGRWYLDRLIEKLKAK